MQINLLSFASVMNTVWAIFLAILILLIMITVHEFGHYIVGKIFHFKINEFSIGFGPALFKKTKKSGEVFAIRLIPLGGFCAFEGEEDDEENKSSHPDAFNNKPPWQRILVLIAGAFMNFITAMLCIIVSFAVFGQLLLMAYRVEPIPAGQEQTYYEYSLQDEDIIVSVEGRDIYLVSDLQEALKGGKTGDSFTFTVIRDGKKVKQEVRLRSDIENASVAETAHLFRAIGVQEADGEFEIYSCKVKLGFFQTIGRAFVYAIRIAGTIFTVLGELLTGVLGLSAMGGPVTTISVTSQIVSQGLLQFLEMTAYIGINLAVFNLLPIPALDGSKVIFTTIEWIRGKPLNRKVENIIHFFGMMLILGFAVLVDLLQLF